MKRATLTVSLLAGLVGLPQACLPSGAGAEGGGSGEAEAALNESIVLPDEGSPLEHPATDDSIQVTNPAPSGEHTAIEPGSMLRIPRWRATISRSSQLSWDRPRATISPCAQLSWNRPRATITVSIPFDAPEGNVVGAGIRFGATGPVRVVNLPQFAGQTQGTLSFALEVPSSICGDLSNICHDIKCSARSLCSAATATSRAVRS